MATSAAVMDSADEAGGEAVFTSDGLPSLSAPLPPPPLPPIGGIGAKGSNDAENDNNNDAVVEEGADPRAAFESFVEATEPSSSSPPVSAAAAGWEDPRRRLRRLAREVDELEATLAAEANDGNNDDDDGEGKKEGTRAATAELKTRLVALGSAAVDAEGLATMLRGRQEDLSKVIAGDLERFGRKGDGDGIDKKMEGLSLSGEAEAGSGQKIVYELFRAGSNFPNNATSATAAIEGPREAALEERLRRLELAVGSSSSSQGSTNDNNNSKSVLERVEEAERLARETDPGRVEKLAAKARVVRADLEAAARARTKLSAAASSNHRGIGGGNGKDGNNKEDAATIAALHAQMIELDGTGSFLPALASRLAELSGLHASAAGFATRLDAAERAAHRAEGTLKGVEEALGRMEGGWRDNLERVERNVERLDGLLLAKAKEEGSS